MDALQKFGLELKALRMEKGLSQEELALLCNLHRTYIGGVERGKRNISLLNILKISKALSVKPGELLRCFDISEDME